MNAYREAGDVLLKESGCVVRKWRTSTTGVAYTSASDWGIETPHPRGPISFVVLAHEVGHQTLHRGNGGYPRWREEVEAAEYALTQFDRFGLKGRERAELHELHNIAWSFQKAIRRSDELRHTIAGTYPEWWAKVLAIDEDGMLDA